MAKGKHAAALFEVISKSKPAEPRSAPKAERVRAPRAESTSPGMTVDVDSDHHLISMKLSFAAAGTAATAVVVLMILAFLVGRRVGAGGLPAVVESTEQLRQHPPHPTVLNIGRQANNAQPAPLLLTSASTETQTAPAPAPSPVIVVNPQRQVALNYVIIQSYPDEKSATEARDMLIANNVPCTLEKGPAGWVPMNWFSVIGTTGFERARGTQYDVYIQTIQAVGAKFAGTSKFKRFEPHAYKWKDTH